MKPCCFCGRPANTNEHIVATWLVERLGSEKIPISIAHRVGDEIREIRTHLFNTFTTGICARCNNNWMSDLESWFGRNLGELVVSPWPNNAADILTAALKEGVNLAQWALKTAITFSKSTEKWFPDLIDGHTARELGQGRIASDIIVELGYIHEAETTGLLRAVINHMNPDGTHQWRRRAGLSFTLIFQINHLAIRVFRAPGVLHGYIVEDGRHALRWHPNADDPRTVDFQFQTLREFDGRLVFNTDIAGS